MAACVFCEIVAGRSPASIVYRDAACVAFMDISPVNPGHLLVVPLRHATYLADLDPEAGHALFATAQRLAQAVRRSGVRADGVNLYLADGEAAGQEVFHVHLHVVPRYAGDGFGLRLPSGYGHQPQREELDATARAIGEALGKA